MIILLLGSEGMLGRELLTCLNSAHRVIGKDMRDFDISLAEDCQRVVEETQPQIIINAAAFTDVDACEAEADRCFAVNALGVRNVALACGKKRIKIVHFSTDYIYDGKSGRPYRENDNCAPLNVYGRSKLAGEKYLFELSDNFLLLRTAWLYGTGGRNFVKTILEKTKKSKQLEVVDDQSGSPTFSADLADVVKRLIEADSRGIYHVTNGGICTWYEFAKTILECAGIKDVEVFPIKSHRLARAAERPCFSALDGEKLTRTTGITLRPWREALEECIGRINSESS